MVTVGLFLGFLAAIPPPTFTGGTKDQQKTLSDAYSKVPECMKSEKPQVIEILDDPTFGAYYDWANDKMIVPRGILDKETQDAGTSLYGKLTCSKASEYDIFRNMDRVVLHEIAHGWHHRTNEAEVTKFLKLRFEAQRDAWMNDKDRQALTDEYEKLQDQVKELLEAKKEVPAASSKRLCELKEDLMKRYKKLGLPTRADGDMHAVDDADGSEYFAMAVEMLVYDHKGFCATYSEQEQAWLRDNLSACLRNLTGTAPCFNGAKSGTTPKTPNATFLRP